VPEAAAALPPEPPPAAADLPQPRRRERDPGEEAGDTAISLLELMAAGTGLQPQERALAGDTLLLLPRLPSQQLARMAERLATMDNPPPLVVSRLIRDPRPEVMSPLLERSAQLSDPDMIDAAAHGDVERLRLLARRRVLSPVLSAHIATCGDPGVVLALLRNPGAQLPHHAFEGLCALAAEHPVLLAPLATRPDLPAAAAFELCWSLPPELRRLSLSRFLTDSTTLGRILRISLAEDGGPPGGALRSETPVAPEALDAALEAAGAARIEEASLRFGELAGLSEGTVRRILTDPYGEPSAVLFKAIGASRTRFIEAMETFRAGGLLGGSSPDEIQALFDGLSFIKARVLVTYWDWFTRKTGPYAPRS
jgi:hypothetical protein